jgi:YD repeat-containing protein
VTVTDQAGKQRRSITNALGQLARVDEPNSANNLGTIDAPVQATNYSYEALGNLKTVEQPGTTAAHCGTTTVPCNQTRSFSLRSLSRLRSATNPESGTITYVYDNNGNLKTKTDARAISTNYSYDALNRVITRTTRTERLQLIIITTKGFNTNAPYALGKQTRVVAKWRLGNRIQVLTQWVECDASQQKTRVLLISTGNSRSDLRFFCMNIF